MERLSDLDLWSFTIRRNRKSCVFPVTQVGNPTKRGPTLNFFLLKTHFHELLLKNIPTNPIFPPPSLPETRYFLFGLMALYILSGTAPKNMHCVIILNIYGTFKCASGNEVLIYVKLSITHSWKAFMICPQRHSLIVFILNCHSYTICW